MFLAKESEEVRDYNFIFMIATGGFYGELKTEKPEKPIH